MGLKVSGKKKKNIIEITVVTVTVAVYFANIQQCAKKKNKLQLYTE